MNTILTMPDPRSVQLVCANLATRPPSYKGNYPNEVDIFRLKAADGRVFAQLTESERIRKFPDAFKAYVLTGKDNLDCRDIPLSLQKITIDALKRAGWCTAVQLQPDPALIGYGYCIPYGVGGVAYTSFLVWSDKPVPPTPEERFCTWWKNFFANWTGI